MLIPLWFIATNMALMGINQAPIAVGREQASRPYADHRIVNYNIYMTAFDESWVRTGR